MRIRLISAALMALGLALPVKSESLSGAYLAGTVANFGNDYDEVADYYTRALAIDPGNPFLLRQAMFASVAIGDFKLATPLARRLKGLGGPDPFTGLLLYADAAEQGAWQAAQDLIDNSRDSFNPLLFRLLSAWAHYGNGELDEAERLLSEDNSEAAIALYSGLHLALMYALEGDVEIAEALFAQPEMQPLGGNRLAVLAHAQVLSALGRNEEALGVLSTAMRQGLADNRMIGIARQIQEGGRLSFEAIQSPTEGIAEAILLLADALDREESYRAALYYTQIAAELAPQRAEAAILAGDILVSQFQYNLAERAYARVPESSFLYLSAQIGRSEALRMNGDIDAATKVLDRLTKTFPDNPGVYSALGDLMRSEERYDEAAPHYDHAVELTEAGGGKASWVLHYTRGISHERIGNWEQADASFRMALEVEPDQPLVLNYLGYSLVERRENLDEALKMIETAVEQRPEDGYIVDSLAWVYYRLDRFEDAVEPMERAASLLPVDPIINDHLGDVYWMVGRKREARFQWTRALSFDPEEKELERIRRKLEVGLDQVLAEEADAE